MHVICNVLHGICPNRYLHIWIKIPLHEDGFQIPEDASRKITLDHIMYLCICIGRFIERDGAAAAPVHRCSRLHDAISKH
jgi:hypothetical protein